MMLDEHSKKFKYRSNDVKKRFQNIKNTRLNTVLFGVMIKLAERC